MNQEIELKNNLLAAYKNLSLDNQRNEFNKEIVVLSSLVNKLLENYGETSLHKPHNYELIEDSNMSESEVLTNNYMDLLELKNNIILLLSYMQKDK